MDTAQSLSLAEQLFLLTIDNDRGKVVPFASQSMRYGLAGALLAELSLLGAIRLEEKKLAVIRMDSLKNELLEDTLQRILAENQPRKATYWVNLLATRKLVSRVAEVLESRQVLSTGERRYHWLPAKDGKTAGWQKFVIKAELRGIVLAGMNASAQEIVLLNLLGAGGLLNLVFTRDEIKGAEKRVAILAADERVGKAVAETIRNIESAAASASLAAMS